MKHLVLSAAFVPVLWIGLYVQGKQETKPVINGPSEAALKTIANSGEKETFEVLGRLGKDRLDLQARLFKELGAATKNEKKAVFVYLMGFYRLEETVWTLANIIDLECPQPIIHDALPLLSRYPVVDALIRIGMPSIRAVIGRLEKDNKELVVELGTKVIDGILGRELGEMAIKQAIDKQTDRDKRKKLEEALAFFKNKLRR